MGQKKYPDYNAFTALADDDLLLGVDVSDTTQSGAGSSKNLPISVLATKIREGTTFKEQSTAAGDFVSLADADKLLGVDVSDSNTAKNLTLSQLAASQAMATSHVKRVTDLDALRGVTGMQDGQTVEIVTTGRSGTFRWDSSNLAVQVTADAQMGVYVPPTGQDGSAGAWVRVYSGLVNAQWFGALGDGVSDDTVALQAFLDNGGGGVPYTDNFYLVSTSLVVPSGSSLIGIGGRAKIKIAAGANANVISATSAIGIEITSIDADGNESQQTVGEYHAISLTDCQGVTVSDVRAHDSVYPNIGLYSCSNIRMSRIVCERSPADGIKIKGCSNGYFEDISVSDFPYITTHAAIGAVAGVQVDDGSRDLTFVGVQCDGKSKSVSSLGFDISSHVGEGLVSSVRIYGLKTTGCGTGLSVYADASDITVSGHRSTDDRIGAVIKDSDRVSVSGFLYETTAEYSLGSTPYGIALSESCSNLSLENGKVAHAGTALYFDTLATGIDRLSVKDVEFTSTTTGSLWIRLQDAASTCSARFHGCSFAGESTGFVALVSQGVLDIDFTECEMIENSDSSQPVFAAYTGGLRFTRSKWGVQTKTPFQVSDTADEISLLDCSFTGAGTGTAVIVTGLGVSRLRLAGCSITGFAYGVQLPAGTSTDVSKDIAIERCFLKDISSAFIRVLGTTDAQYVERLTIGGNILDNVASALSGFPLGTSASDLISYGNNPAITIPT